MFLLNYFHSHFIYERRIQRLTRILSTVLPHNVSMLDVGCGDGLLDREIKKQRPDLAVAGIDVLLRPQTHIPVTQFDGFHIPYRDKTFDIVMLIDVLHHAADPEQLMSECLRVSKTGIIIKDHIANNKFQFYMLKFMDWTGNASHGVRLPYNYWSAQKWNSQYQRMQLKKILYQTDLHLYPWPASLFFDSTLHFIIFLTPENQ